MTVRWKIQESKPSPAAPAAAVEEDEGDWDDWGEDETVPKKNEVGERQQVIAYSKKREKC